MTDELIESILTGLDVDFAKLRYYGNAETYIVYQLVDTEWKMSADDYPDYFIRKYDVDIYSKYNYDELIENVIDAFESNNFSWEINDSSGDIYEEDTGLYHRTLCFSIITWRNNNG